MCKQCPTVGEFICGILRCGCGHEDKCENKCERKCEHRCEHKCEHGCERLEKRFECYCQDKKEPAPCPRQEKEKETGCHDCVCKYY